ncbi:MAG: PhnD/SsuA/transferrin family substrate-binding protein, partial [Actinomycetia bacterium]|nr:PhnD/SsuA/transferrin family substrate-binding protein [Actinomycetes bacterium]
GAVKEEIFYKYKDRGLKLLASTTDIPEHILVTRTGIDKKLFNVLQKAVLELNKTDEGKIILKSIKSTATGFKAVSDSDYNRLRKIIKEMDK